MVWVPDASDDTLLTAIASALHTSSAPITGQTSTAAEKNPAIWLNTAQPLCKAFIVTDEDIRYGPLRVHEARRSLGGGSAGRRVGAGRRIHQGHPGQGMRRGHQGMKSPPPPPPPGG
ncbi:hypothetical protein ACEWY4_004521 [Coilia grayii]|uniref:Methyl-CpG binding protein 2/3 C-terminal domain-containing protein n=1 Tax=Coilia grayii TaxID=363190 RepID=A0ABD1KLW8_9TELE